MKNDLSSASFPSVESLASRFTGPVITRLAPSPTGFLHQGHLIHFAFVLGWIRLLNGQWIFRLENHDKQRCKPEYEKAIVSVIEKLLDEWPCKRPDGVFYQSDFEEEYLQVAEMLTARGEIYGCTCSRKDIHERTGQEEGELKYDNHCRDKNIAPSAKNTWRFRIDESGLAFDDLMLGKQVQNPARETGDLAIRDKKGNWTYHYCVVLDDIREQVSLVIRGDDLLDSTGRQIKLYNSLESKPPLYLHHPLITNKKGRKLSKRDFDGNLSDLLMEFNSADDLLAETLEAGGITNIRNWQEWLNFLDNEG